MSDERPQTKIERILDTAEALVDAADVAMRATGPLGRVAVALKLTHTAIRVWNTWRPRHHDGTDPMSYFTTEPGWTPVAYGEAMAALDGVPLPGEPAPGWEIFGDGGLIKCAVYVAKIEGGEVGWVSANASSVEACGNSVHVRGEKMPARIRAMARSRLWRDAGVDRMLQVTDDGSGVPMKPPTHVVPTAGVRDTAARVRRFWDRGVFRAYLLDGEPGTGKTTAALHIAHDLGASIAVMDAVTLIQGASVVSPSVNDKFRADFSSMWMMELLGPDILVLNDVDRLDEKRQLAILSVLERARKFARAVFLTTNNPRALVEPIRRPGRVDDIVSIKGLTPAEVVTVAGDAVPIDLLPKMTGWPIAYVLDVRSRAEVLGPEAVRAEIHEVSDRLADVRSALERRRDPDET